MATLRNPLTVIWRWIIAPPDEVLADAAREGETLVARVRVWLTLLILTIPLLSLALMPDSPEHWAGLLIAASAVAVAIALDIVVRKGAYNRRLATFTTLTDVTVVTGALLTYWLLGSPIVTSNSRVIFDAYFIVIAASALRYSPIVCVVAGVGSMLQFLALSALVYWVPGPGGLTTMADQYGSFDWATQFSRVVLLAAMTVMALAVVNRSSRLRRLSTFDRLTGLFNRAYVEEYLGHELTRATRESRPFTVAMLDVDHFKAFNDTHGHAGGDAGLRTLADTLRFALRRSDVVARFGGEEILIAMPGTDNDAAIEKLDEVRIKVGLTDVKLPRGGSARFTVSMGVASLGLDGEQLDTLLDAADARLYQAKEAGRNRVIGNP
jgi:two-component system cell cycle response regulator